ncbi:MAG: adenylosuccinate synthase, partial [Chloroflexi bacterium]|nr:adenylosuccinate synthase [Chloroflexota bacterium]
GKGKIVDLLAEKANLVARYSGGSNAGHTVINQFGEFRLHLVPSGIFHRGVDCVIGNGVAVNPKILIGEIDDLQRQGIDVSHLSISDRAHLIMPYHIVRDELEEKARGSVALGTTKQGIGPAYADKVARRGLRAGDLKDMEQFGKRLRSFLTYQNETIVNVFEATPLSFDEIYGEYRSYARRLAPFVKETSRVVNEAVDRGDMVLLEGAQGTMLDIDFGTYPYVTSSPPTAWGACLGMGLSPRKIDKIVGVFKAYTTRVGGGPFPTELLDTMGEEIRKRGKEYGTTTGRPRRCGWFDGVAARFSAMLNGYTGFIITKFDILDVFSAVKICTGYELDGHVLEHPPSNADLLAKCRPIYEEMPGWQVPTSDIRSVAKLPDKARRYIKRMEEIVGCPVNFVSVGARREQSIAVSPII